MAYSGKARKYKPEKYSDFTKSVQLLLPNRMISTSEFTEYFNIMETYGIKQDAMLLIINYCIDKKGNEVVTVCNFTPCQREGYRIGLPVYGDWVELFNSDLAEFGGGNVSNGLIKTDPEPMHGFDQSAALTLPPLSVLVLKNKKVRPYPKKKSTAKAKTDNK